MDLPHEILHCITGLIDDLPTILALRLTSRAVKSITHNAITKIETESRILMAFLETFPNLVSLRARDVQPIGKVRHLIIIQSRHGLFMERTIRNMHYKFPDGNFTIGYRRVNGINWDHPTTEKRITNGFLEVEGVLEITSELRTFMVKYKTFTKRTRLSFIVTPTNVVLISRLQLQLDNVCIKDASEWSHADLRILFVDVNNYNSISMINTKGSVECIMTFLHECHHELLPSATTTINLPHLICDQGELLKKYPLLNVNLGV